jgi:hypothetical protein
MAPAPFTEEEKLTTEEEIAEAFGQPGGLKPALDRWIRSRKDWADRAMLVNAILEHFTGSAGALASVRIEVFNAAKKAASAVK